MKTTKNIHLFTVVVLTCYGCGGGNNTNTLSQTSSSPTSATVTISSVSLGTSTVTLSGQNFGIKSSPAPAYFNNFDSVAIGAMPSDQISNLTPGNQGLVKSNIVRSGSKSLEFNYAATAGVSQNDWKRNAVDLGSGGADKIYATFWVYMDKGSSTCTSWQWKGPITITSQSNLYYDLPSPANINSTTAFTSYWFFDNSYWSNPSSGLYYYNNVTSSNQSGVIATGTPRDLLAWGKWMRLEFYAQRSSSGGMADGIWRGRRLDRGSDTFNYTNAITHQTGNNTWRYVALSHAIESVYNGYVNLNVYMDDVYVDTTPARVEMCNTSTWAARTHCEIQPPTVWSDTGITATLNKGSFASNDMVYFYVLDNNGNVNPNGHLYQLP